MSSSGSVYRRCGCRDIATGCQAGGCLMSEAWADIDLQHGVLLITHTTNASQAG